MSTPYAFVVRIEAKPEKAEDVAAVRQSRCVTSASRRSRTAA